MNNISEEEARALFIQPLICEDCSEWRYSPGVKGEMNTGAGLLNEQGVGVKLYADLTFRRSPKTNTVRYVFTVFRRGITGSERVYQLDITQWPKPVRDLHQMPHEHIGAGRYLGDDSWSTWTYHDVIARFCSQTNITFSPLIPDPEDFKLKG